MSLDIETGKELEESLIKYSLYEIIVKHTWLDGTQIENRYILYSLDLVESGRNLDIYQSSRVYESSRVFLNDLFWSFDSLLIDHRLSAKLVSGQINKVITHSTGIHKIGVNLALEKLNPFYKIKDFDFEDLQGFQGYLCAGLVFNLNFSKEEKEYLLLNKLPIEILDQSHQIGFNFTLPKADDDLLLVSGSNLDESIFTSEDLI